MGYQDETNPNRKGVFPVVKVSKGWFFNIESFLSLLGGGLGCGIFMNSQYSVLLLFFNMKLCGRWFCFEENTFFDVIGIKDELLKVLGVGKSFR